MHALAICNEKASRRQLTVIPKPRTRLKERNIVRVDGESATARARPDGHFGGAQCTTRVDMRQLWLSSRREVCPRLAPGGALLPEWREMPRWRPSENRIIPSQTRKARSLLVPHPAIHTNSGLFTEQTAPRLWPAHKIIPRPRQRPPPPQERTEERGARCVLALRAHRGWSSPPMATAACAACR